MKKIVDLVKTVETKATFSASIRLFMERGKNSLSGELEAVGRYFVRNVETSLLGKLKWRVTWKQFMRGKSKYLDC